MRIKCKIAIVFRHKSGGDTVSRWRNNGGWNKRCGTVENTPRIDSYEAGAVAGWGHLFGHAGKGLPLTLECEHFIDYGPETDREIVELRHPKQGWTETLQLSRKLNGYGGSQAFFLCPGCGERRRYLYQVGTTFLCRKCAQVNYGSQQATRSGSMFFYRKGVALVEKRLETWPRVRPDGFSFCAWIPECPRYMHQSTYRRYLAQFLRYRRQHEARQLEDMARLLRIFK